ncbi:hypothetical protein GCM10009118_10660 [Wandonia haliotis]|uniref:Uncharacterized protein n=1 Tax=Wandonia haliotis TaxID=574963 RepID=A0ABP3Y1Y3_9FLAO
MDVERAKILFNCPEDTDPQEMYEEILFEVKKQLTTRPAVPKLFLKKAIDLQGKHEAALLLFGELEIFRVPENKLNETEFTGEWGKDYSKLMQIRNNYKLLIMSSGSGEQIVHLVKEWMNWEKKFCKQFATIFTKEEAEGIFVSKENDPMLLLEGLQQVKGRDRVEELSRSKNQLPDILQNELKRLTLLLNYLE